MPRHKAIQFKTTLEPTMKSQMKDIILNKAARRLELSEEAEVEVARDSTGEPDGFGDKVINDHI